MLPEDDVEGCEHLPEAKYTNSGSSKKHGRGSSWRFHGWSREGYLRFNTLHAEVKEDCKRRANFELEFQKVMEEAYMESRKAEMDSEEEEEEIIPANDILGVKQPAEPNRNKCNIYDANNSNEEDDDSEDGEEK